MDNEQILVVVALYPFLCVIFFLSLMLLEESYSDKMLINEIKVKSDYPMGRWFLHTVIFLLIPIVFVIEVLKVGFTKDK